MGTTARALEPPAVGAGTVHWAEGLDDAGLDPQAHPRPGATRAFAAPADAWAVGHAPAFAIVLLKGTLWQGNAGCGAIHRSPVLTGASALGAAAATFWPWMPCGRPCPLSEEHPPRAIHRPSAMRHWRSQDATTPCPARLVPGLGPGSGIVLSPAGFAIGRGPRAPGARPPRARGGIAQSGCGRTGGGDRAGESRRQHHRL